MFLFNKSKNNATPEVNKNRPPSTIIDGGVYVGELRENTQIREGKGQFSFHGDFYDGDWLNDRKEGFGRMIYCGLDGNVYEGNWKNDLKHGYGELTFRKHSDSYYKGEFKNGFHEGVGTYQDQNGDHFEGNAGFCKGAPPLAVF